MDEYDLDGLLNVLSRKAEESNDDPYYAGAYTALNLIRHCDFRDQVAFMAAFESVIKTNQEEEGNND